MGRIRYLKPGFFTNEELSALPPLTRLLFAGIWTLSDCKGRLEDRPKRIKAELFAYDEFDVDAALTALHNAGFIVRYRVKEQDVIQINKFNVHQRPHPKEPDAKLPEPPKLGAKTKSRDRSRQSRKRSGLEVQSRSNEPETFTAEPGIDLDLDLDGDEKDQDQDHRAVARASYPVVLKLAYQAITEAPDDSKSALKCLCARYQIPYDIDVVTRALDAAEHQAGLRVRES
jgi:hypothetical protein